MRLIHIYFLTGTVIVTTAALCKIVKYFNSYYCNNELIIGSNVDIDESMQPDLYAEFSVITNLSCPKCFAEVEVLKKRNAYD